MGSKLNARWIWIALCRQTRQVVAYFVGDRSAKSACALRERIPLDYRGRATRSDWWLADAEVFPRRTHRLCGKGEGETCHVERWNGNVVWDSNGGANYSAQVNAVARDSDGDGIPDW